MAVPTFVGAGSGVEVTTGTQTMSKTGCTAGNLLLAHVLFRGTSEDWATSSVVNINHLGGGSGFDLIVANRGVGDLNTSKMSILCGLAAANGTCSVDMSVGASGNDFVARIYEFSGQYPGTTHTQVMENGGSDVQGIRGTN